MILEKDIFVNYTKEKPISVCLSDGSSLNVQEKGDAYIVLNNNIPSNFGKIKNVLFFPYLGSSLLSVSTLVHNGSRATFDLSQGRIFTGKL